jgi:hypothetical protein
VVAAQVGVGDLEVGAWIAFGGLVLMIIGVAGLRRYSEVAPEAIPGYSAGPTAGPTPTH